jgi:hypothetical protein
VGVPEPILRATLMSARRYLVFCRMLPNEMPRDACAWIY